MRGTATNRSAPRGRSMSAKKRAHIERVKDQMKGWFARKPDDPFAAHIAPFGLGSVDPDFDDLGHGWGRFDRTVAP